MRARHRAPPGNGRWPPGSCPAPRRSAPDRARRHRFRRSRPASGRGTAPRPWSSPSSAPRSRRRRTRSRARCGPRPTMSGTPRALPRSASARRRPAPARRPPLARPDWRRRTSSSTRSAASGELRARMSALSSAARSQPGFNSSARSTSTSAGSMAPGVDRQFRVERGIRDGEMRLGTHADRAWPANGRCRRPACARAAARRSG